MTNVSVSSFRRRSDKLHLKSRFLGGVGNDHSSRPQPQRPGCAARRIRVLGRAATRTCSAIKNPAGRGKRRAARHAAALLEAHQMAFFDCGTTTPWIIDAIDDALPFTGVCYPEHLSGPAEKPSAARSCAVGSFMPATRFYAAEP